MGRRQFLKYTLAAVTTGLAGCSALGGSESVEETYEPDAGDHLAVAIGNLNKAALAVSRFQDQSSNDDEDTGKTSRSFDPAGPRERIETARDAITQASEAGGEASQKDVAAVSQYADGVEGTVNAVASITTAADRLEAARETLDGEDIDTDAASATLAEATDASSQAETAHSDATTALGEADTDQLESLDAEASALASGLDSLKEFVVGVDGLAVGYEQQVTGIKSLQTAQDRVDTEAFDGAKTAFTTAQTAFAESATTFSDALSGTASELKTDLTEGDKRSRSLDQLAAGYVSLLTSRDHVKSAETALENNSTDSARTSLTDGRDAATGAREQFDTGDGILNDEFAEEFATATDRATAMQALTDGYTSLLDGTEHLEAVESQLGEGDSETLTQSLTDASADATTAEETFRSAEGLAPDLFGGELQTEQNRANALDSLAVGYTHLVDGRDRLDAGESAFLDDQFTAAETAFNDATTLSGQAETAFNEGDTRGEGSLFAEEFDTGTQRAAVLDTLGRGYATVVQGQQEAVTGQEELESRSFTVAESQFQTAATTFGDAETTFSNGQDTVDEQFESTLNQALCRVGHLIAATDHFIAAAQAGANRDRQTLQDERDAGEADLERVNEC